MIAGIYGWVLEPSTDPSAGHGDHGDEHHDGGDSDAATLDEPSASDAAASGEDAQSDDRDVSDREPEPAMASAARGDQDGVER